MYLLCRRESRYLISLNTAGGLVGGCQNSANQIFTGALHPLAHAAVQCCITCYVFCLLFYGVLQAVWRAVFWNVPVWGSPFLSTHTLHLDFRDLCPPLFPTPAILFGGKKKSSITCRCFYFVSSCQQPSLETQCREIFNSYWCSHLLQHFVLAMAVRSSEHQTVSSAPSMCLDFGLL